MLRNLSFHLPTYAIVRFPKVHILKFDGMIPQKSEDKLTGESNHNQFQTVLQFAFTLVFIF